MTVDAMPGPGKDRHAALPLWGDAAEALAAA
jgi:hypothetical protein